MYFAVLVHASMNPTTARGPAFFIAVLPAVDLGSRRERAFPTDYSVATPAVGLHR
jgi:hypothetical protein